jgi:UDP-2,4-diacetamido-2,4,6-trideoxy-beta-L-altropyranose hydrolase
LVNKSKIIAFVANASNKIGGGHVYRCLPIYRELSKLGSECIFVTNQDTLDIIPELSKCDCLLYQDKEQIADLLNIKFKRKILCIFIDDYTYYYDSESALRKSAEKLIIFDDTATTKHDGDYFICITPGLNEADYGNHTPSGSQFLFGPAFAPLRSQFLSHRYESLKNKKHNVEHILVSTGASDPLGITKLFIEAVCASEYKNKLTIILGGVNELDNATLNILNNSGINYSVYSSVENMAEIISTVDLALGASGNSSWERCCLGIPSLIFEIADNQNKISSYLDNTGAAINLGKPVNILVSKVSNIISQLINDPFKIAEMSKRAARIVDGLGVGRIIFSIFPELSENGVPVYLVQASKDDIELVYEWQKEPGMRNNFFNNDVPNYETHTKWIIDKLEDPLCIFNIIYLDKVPVGVLRFDMTQRDTHLVSIYLSSKYRKLGIAKSAIEIAKKQLYKSTLHAEILENNLDSINLFKSAGFVFKNNVYVYS